MKRSAKMWSGSRGGRITPGAYRKRDHDHFKRLFANAHVAARSGFEEFIRKVMDADLPTAIGSLTQDEQARTLIARARLDRFFKPEAVVLKSNVKRLKPAPDVFLETAKRMGIHPAEQLVFEDSPRGVRAARDAGSRAIGMPVYEFPHVRNELLAAGAEAVYLNWNSVPLYELLRK